MAVDVFAEETLVDVIAGEVLVALASEIAAEGDATLRLVCVVSMLLVEVITPATLIRSSTGLAVMIPPIVPQPNQAESPLLISNL